MKESEIINEIISNSELVNSPLLLSWIQESEENLNLYIAYKNRYALLQDGVEMSEDKILRDLERVKKRTFKSKKHFFDFAFFKYAAIIVMLIIGGYSYYSASIKSSPEISMNEIFAPEGERSCISLPDGSEIILVNGSKVTYPSLFAGDTREIYLEGSAYLTIEENEKCPFIVHVGHNQIEVLGTEFLVTAHPKGNMVMIDLVSGKVKMIVPDLEENKGHESYLLEPKQSLVFNKLNRDAQIYKTEDNFHAFWKEGKYLFKNESFISLAHKLERIYNTTINFEDELLHSYDFTGALYAKSSLITTLEVFKKASSTPFEFIAENNQVYIKHLK